MKILSSHFAAICDKYDSPAPNGSFARRCEAARSSEKNSLTAKIFKYALTAALFLLATAFLIGAAAGYWIIVSRSDVPTSGICLYDSTNLLRYYLADESSDQFGKALDGDLGSASATYDGEFHFPIVSKTPIKKFDGYDKALLPLQFADFNYGGDLTQAYFDDFGYEYVLLTGFSAGAKISPENIKTSAEILKNQSNYTWIAGVPSDAGVYAVRITSLEEVTVVGSSATRSKYGSYIVIYTIAPATATITEAAPLGGSFIVENASSAQSAATMADDSIEGGDGTFIYGVDESGKPLNQGVKVTSLTLGGSSHSVSGYSDSSVGSVKNGLNIVLSDNVKSAANHSEADNENFWYTVTASLSGAEAGNYALSNATSLRFRIAPVELNADDIKWYYDGEATNGKTVVYDGSEHGLTALIDETTVSNRYYAKYGNDESVKSAVKSLIDAINGGSAPLTLGVYTRSNDNYTAAIPSTAKVAKNAGIYLFSADVYLGGERSTDVYLATEATNTLTINAAQLMVNYGSDPVYEGKAQQPTFTLAGLIGNDGMGVNAKVTQGATVVEPINVGSYTLTLSVSGETYLNYVFGEPTLTTETSTSHNYKIIPKPVSLTTSNVSDITYDGVVHAPTATYIDVSGDTVNAVAAIAKDGTDINANDVKNAGKYALTASLKDTTNYVWADNNTTDDKTYNWTISTATVSLTTSNVRDVTYDGVVHAPTATYIDVSGANVDAVTSITKDGTVINANDVKNAGAYTLTASLKGTTNYVWDDNTTADKTYNWTISKLKITVEVTNANQSATYNGAEPTINTDTTVTLTGSVASVPPCVSNELLFSVTKETGVNAGTYTLTPSAKAKSGYSVDNYDITPTNGTFTINKAALTVTANSENITYGDDKPTFSVSYSGFVNNENESVLGGSLVLECGYVRYGNVGTYSITPIGLTSGNYAITFESGRLKVSKKQITAKISLLSDSIYVTDHVLSVAKPSVEFSGLVNGDTLTVTYTAVNNETTVATPLTDSTTLEKGVYTVNAVFSGDKAGNYDITVTPATLTVKENDGTVTKVAVPDANTGLVYNASNQDGITHNQANYGDYYTVSGTASAINAGTYSVTVTLKDKTSCVWADNNTTADKTYEWTIDRLYLKFSGIIEIDYGGSPTLSQALLRGKLTSTNGTIPTGNAAPSFSSAVARTYDSSTDDNNAYTETKDAQGNITSISGEHGYYKVTLNSAFTVGSTYKVTAVLNSDNYAFAVGGNTIIVKYKTAKIGNAYYTIEDALSESASGNITLAGNSSGSASYIITSFTMLSNTMLPNYNDSKSYTLSGRKLIVPYNANGDERNTFTDSGSFGNVYSALIIPNGVSLNLEKKETNNATLTVAAYVGFNQNISTTLAKEHGVLINNGNLIVQSGCTINAHGYIKGTGLIELKNGATAVDALSIYDWPGGNAALFINGKAFPSNAYTMHNISCETKIYGGAFYNSNVYVTATTIGTNGYNALVPIVGTSSCMFNTNAKDVDTYIIKSVTGNTKINSKISDRSNQTKNTNHRDNIVIHGDYYDSSVEISVSLAKIATSTSVPLPIGYMDVTVSKGTLSLSASDYMILPGATIKVEKGANLVVGNKVDITAVPYNTVSAYGGDRNYTAFSTWNNTNKINGRLIINGTLTCVSGANIGGLVECETDGATVILKNTTATYKTMYSTNKPYYASGTLSAKGYVLSAADSSIERNLASGTYYSIQLSDGTFVWYSTSANIEFDSRGGSAVSSLTRTVGNGGYTITADDVASEPTKNYYDFCGWYIDSECTTEAKGQTIFCSTTLYAKWSPTPYTIIFEARYDGCETSGSFHPGQGSFDTENGCYCMQLDYESKDYTLLDASDGDLVFLGWYTDEAFTTAIQIISKYTVTGDMTLYARFLPAGTTVYTIKYDLRDSDNAPNGLSLLATTVLSTQTGSYTPHNYANDYNNNAEKSYYFLGWYTNADRTVPYTNWTSLTNTNENTNEFTLYAKWDKKLELQIKLTVDGTTITVPTGKYYYYGNNYTITKWSEKLTNVSTLFDTEYKHIGFSSVEDNIATVTVEKYVNANVDEFTITVNSKPANPPEAIILVADVRKVIKVTLNMSATAEKCGKLSHSIDSTFNITSVELDTMLWFLNNTGTPWYESGSPQYSAKGESIFYVLQGSIIKVQTDQKNCKNLIGGDCGKKATLTKNQVTCSGCSVKDAGNGTFTITPNGNGAVNVTWSGNVKAS